MMVSLDFNNDDDKKNNKEINSIELMKFILDFFFGHPSICVIMWNYLSSIWMMRTNHKFWWNYFYVVEKPCVDMIFFVWKFLEKKEKSLSNKNHFIFDK